MSYAISLNMDNIPEFSSPGFGRNETLALESFRAMRNLSPEQIQLMREEAKAASVRAQRKLLLDALESGDEDKLVRAMTEDPDFAIDVYGTTALHYIIEKFETIQNVFFLEAALGMKASLTVQDKHGRSALDRMDDEMRQTVASVMVHVGREEEARNLFPTLFCVPTPQEFADLNLFGHSFRKFDGERLDPRDVKLFVPTASCPLATDSDD